MIRKFICLVLILFCRDFALAAPAVTADTLNMYFLNQIRECLSTPQTIGAPIDRIYSRFQPISEPVSQYLQNYYQSYGNFCEVRDFAAAAEEQAKRSVRNFLCYRGVKQIIHNSGPWLLSSPLEGGNAFEAQGELEGQGYYNAVADHPELKQHPELAPPGAFIVYKRNDVPCKLGRSHGRRKVDLCTIVKSGDIQIRTQNGFANDGFSPNSMLEQPLGPYVEVAAVLIKPLKAAGYDSERGCFYREP